MSASEPVTLEQLEREKQVMESIGMTLVPGETRLYSSPEGLCVEVTDSDSVGHVTEDTDSTEDQ
jgi:hypothetical protein